MPVVTQQKTIGNHRPVPKPAASAWDLIDAVRLLLYGESGTGKTTLWATFPGPILALICSGGNKPGELRSINTPEYRRKIVPRIITSTDQFRDEIASAREYSTVVLDHASGFQDLILKEILGLDDILLAKYRTAGKGESWSVVSQQQYGQLAIQCKELFRALLNVPNNIVIVAQQRVFSGKEDGMPTDIVQPVIGASLTPSVAAWLNPACDYVIQMFKRPKYVVKKVKIGDKVVDQKSRAGGVDYCARTEPHEVFMTKFRVPKGRPLPDVIVDPTYDKIMQVIRG